MNKRLETLNIVFAVADTIIAGLAIVAFGYLSCHFGRWWISLFMLLPLMTYSNHTLIVEDDIRAQNGGENNSKKEL